MFLSFPAPPGFKVKTPVNFCWWLLTHLSPLYWFTDKGVYSHRKKVKWKLRTYAVNIWNCVTVPSFMQHVMTDGQTDRPTDRQTNGQTDQRTDRKTKRPTDRQTDRWRDRGKDRRNTERPTERQTVKQTERQTDRWTDRGKEGRQTWFKLTSLCSL